ncbi:hypothetical protein [Nannocystis pusilla]|uniref:hypothetical protein n=1 Tax=Nannocystis pusilla TaxID=889268 RepID=UPI003B7C0023
MDVGALFPEWEEVGEEQPAAIAAVCARLGVEREWLTEDDYVHAIVGGAVEGERAAWVEKVEKDDEGWVDVDYFLRMRVGEAQVREWTVDTYNPYFGCEVGHLRWWDDAVVMVYRENTTRSSAEWGRRGAAAAGRRVRVDGAERGAAVREPGAGSGRADPPAGAAADGAAAGGAGRSEHGHGGMSCGTADHERAGGAAAADRGGLARGRGVDRRSADRGAGVSLREPRSPLFATYQEAYADDHPWNTPCWLPFYLYCASSATERAVLLAQLDAVAMRVPEAFAGEDDTAELACRHIAARCAELATACRAGGCRTGSLVISGSIGRRRPSQGQRRCFRRGCGRCGRRCAREPASCGRSASADE